MKLILALCLSCGCLVFCQAQSFTFSNAFNEENNSKDVNYVSTAKKIGRWEFTDLFEEVEYFEEKSKVWQIGIGFRSDVPLQEQAEANDQLDVRFLTPALSLTYEKNVWNNLGVGFTVAGQLWRVPVFRYQYRYYTGGLRVAYHLNVAEQLDPYFGFGGTFRYLELSNNQSNEHNTKITAHWLLGARYYYAEHAAAFFEAGNDSPTWFKAGLALYFE